MSFEFKFDDKDIISYAEKQITQIISDPNFYLRMSKSEYGAIKNHLNRPKKILELGCGIGRMSAYLNHHLSGAPRFILADFTENSEKIKYGWNPGQSFYNDLNLTSKFVQQHGLHNFEVFDLKNTKLSSLEGVDLVMSFLAVGFHYPIEDYMDELVKITTDDCVMIFGTREGKYSKEYFEKYFKTCIIEENTVATKEKILILKDKRKE